MENKECLVSIIVPVFNVEERLKICLDSIIAQSLKNIEIILIDDGSTDKSGMLCDYYAKKDFRVKVFHLMNGGPARARNYGIQCAKGKYVGFVDSDDRVDKMMFEKLYNNAEYYQSDIAMCSYFLEEKDDLYCVKLKYQELFKTNETICEKLLYRYYSNSQEGLPCLWNKLFVRTFVLRNNISFDEKLIRAEDAWFVFECLKVAKKISFLNEPLYFYYQNSLGIMHSIRMDQYETWVMTRKRLLQENKRLGFKIDCNEFYSGFLYKTAVYCRTLVAMGYKEKVKEILEDEFYLNAVNYTGKLPIHIKMIHRFAKYRLKTIVILLYKLWK